MNRVMVLAVAALMAHGAAWADEVKGFVNGGLSSVGFELKDKTGPGRVELEGGGGLNLSGGIEFESGFGLKASYVGTSHDGGTLCTTRCAKFNNDVDLTETRLEGFFALYPDEELRVEFGLGLESYEIEVASAAALNDELEGLLLGAGLAYKATDNVILDGGLKFFGLESDDGTDYDGAELHLGIVGRVSKVDLGARLRGFAVESNTDEVSVGELRLTIGTTFGDRRDSYRY